MVIFEWIVLLLIGAVLLSLVARRLSVPYPTLLALGGAALAVSSRTPPVHLDPELALTLFVAPVLLDAAFDTSQRDLRQNWLPITSLVVVAVGLTTFAVAFVARAFVPDLPWACAIALGAIVAPPDAAAATAVLKQLRPPYRILMILEGESLLNDASALLIFRVAVGAAAAGTVTFGSVAPVLGLGLLGSLIAGPALAWLISKIFTYVSDVPSAIILQFIGAFAVWILAERLHLSGVLTIVVFAMVVSRLAQKQAARIRVPSFAVWETAVFVLNVLAFVFVGLQLGPILARVDSATLRFYFVVAGAVLATVIAVRLVWVFAYTTLNRLFVGNEKTFVPTAGGVFVVGWCGMRGIVTLAGALALPPDFAHRDLILLCSFSVVLGTLVIQGLTLPLFLKIFSIQDDDPVGREIHEGRIAANRAGLSAIDGDDSPSAKAIRQEISDVIRLTQQQLDGKHDDLGPSVASLRKKTNAAARDAVMDLRRNDTIGDAAYHKLEEQLDWAELVIEGNDALEND